MAKNSGGHSDPYVTLRLDGNLADRSIKNLGTGTWFMKKGRKGEKPARTKTIIKTLEPQWYECFELFLPLEAEDAKLVFDVFDANTIKDVPMGTAELKYQHLTSPQPAPKALALKEMETRKKKKSKKAKSAPTVSGFLDVLVYASDLRSVAPSYPPNYSEDESALESPGFGFGYSSSDYGYTTTDDEGDNRSMKSSRSSAGDLEDDDDDEEETMLTETSHRTIDHTAQVPPLNIPSAQAAEEEVKSAAANSTAEA